MANRLNKERFNYVIIRKSKVDQDLYIQFTVVIRTLNIYVELNVPTSYWIQLGFGDFEPLLELYRQGYIEIK